MPKSAKAGKPSSLVDTRVIYCGDNLQQLRKLPDDCVDLIYIDPPFNSNRNYEVFWGEKRERRAFEDRHASTQAYIDFMRPRCLELYRVLKTTGSFYYHCDWHASHYVKVMLDQIFGEDQFQNEIIWRRTGLHSDARKRFAAVTDSIFFYARSADYTFTPQHTAHDPDYIARFYAHDDGDGRGPYALDNMASPNPRPNMMYEWMGFPSPEKGWRYQYETMLRLHDEGRVYYPRRRDGTFDIGKRPRLKRYLNEQKGTIVPNLWTDIQNVQAQSEQRLGYPTQKPLDLLTRIVTASSKPNDIVLDAFCGCGTALVAAEMLGRQWIGIDVSPTACRVMAKRLRDVCHLREDEKLWRSGRGFVVRNIPWTAEKLRQLPPFEFENWAVNAIGGIPNRAQVGDMGIDGRIYPVSAIPKATGAKAGELDFMDVWYPIQVKQKDKVGRPDIDSFEAAMMRADRVKGFFVAFDFTGDALTEIDAFFRKTGKVIAALTVQEIVDEEIAKKLA
jgi:site-specific DNA-methyltransferase (adenine-specific)